MEPQREVAEYFRSLELALNEQEKKGTPKGDPTYSRIYTRLSRDISQIGISRDELPEAAKICSGLSSTTVQAPKRALLMFAANCSRPTTFGSY